MLTTSAKDPALPDQAFDQLVDHFAGAVFHAVYML